MDENENKTPPKGLNLEDDKIGALSARINKEEKKQFGGGFIDATKLAGEVVTPEQDVKTDQEKKLEQEEKDRAERQAAFAIVKPIRTYERDMAENIRKTDASMASINMAEQVAVQKKKLVENPSQNTHSIVQKTETAARNSVIFLASIILIIGTTSVLAILFFVYQNNAPVEQLATEVSIISTDKSKKVDVTGTNREQLLKTISDNLKLENSGSLTEVKLVQKTAGEDQQISSEQFLNVVAKSAPSPLARALGGPWLFGFYNSDHAEPFVLATVSSFDNAFDGMLRWEKDMAKDLENIFLDYDVTTGTSTEKISHKELKNAFEDTVIKSKNVRELRDISGNTVLLYSFLSDKYLVIATNENAFREIFNRFLASPLIR